jgi:hypothetical protein
MIKCQFLDNFGVAPFGADAKKEIDLKAERFQLLVMYEDGWIVYKID